MSLALDLAKGAMRGPLGQLIQRLQLFQLFQFVKVVTVARDGNDALANENSFLRQKGMGSGTFTKLAVSIYGGFVTDGTDYFDVQVAVIDPDTNVTRSTATASFASTTAVGATWSEKSLSAPVTIEDGDLVSYAIVKLGAGVLLTGGLVQLRPLPPPSLSKETHMSLALDLAKGNTRGPLGQLIDTLKSIIYANFILRAIMSKPAADSAANASSSVVGNAYATATYSKISISLLGGFATDLVDYFTVTVVAYDPATGALRGTVIASYQNTTAASGQASEKSLSGPLSVVQGDLIAVAFSKQGAGTLLGLGKVELVK